MDKHVPRICFPHLGVSHKENNGYCQMPLKQMLIRHYHVNQTTLLTPYQSYSPILSLYHIKLGFQLWSNGKPKTLVFKPYFGAQCGQECGQKFPPMLRPVSP